MAADTILVVEDEEDIRELVRFHLEKEGFEVAEAVDGEAALKWLQKHTPVLVALDLMLPVLSGLDVCKRIKSEPRTEDVPVVMLTAKGEEADIVIGLELGADDYITKPFSPRVLVARIRAVLRRRERGLTGEDETIAIHDVVIHPGRHEVTIDGKPVGLTYTEFKVMQTLARRPGWVFTRYQIVDAIRGEDYAVTPRAVDVQIAGLRKKLGEAGKYIETVRGVGYRFAE